MKKKKNVKEQISKIDVKTKCQMPGCGVLIDKPVKYKGKLLCNTCYTEWENMNKTLSYKKIDIPIPLPPKKRKIDFEILTNICIYGLSFINIVMFSRLEWIPVFILSIVLAGLQKVRKIKQW